MFKVTRRARVAVLAAVIGLAVLSTEWSNRRLHRVFWRQAEGPLEVPSSYHVGELNMREFRGAWERRDLRSQLAAQFPYDTAGPIPRRVWQTWKVPRHSAQFPEHFRSLSDAWENSAKDAEGYEYFLVGDEDMLPLLRNLYGGVPQVLQAFESLPLAIMRADFFRYLILYARGGIYSDIDTEPLQPLTAWPSVDQAALQKFKNRKVHYGGTELSVFGESSLTPGLAIGIEADPDRPDWSEYYARRIQFCQWTLQAKAGHPLLRELILNITGTTLHSVARRTGYARLPPVTFDTEHLEDYNVNYRHKKRHDAAYPHTEKKTAKNTDETDIMNWTGPGIFSDVVFDYLNNLITTNDEVVIYNDNLLEKNPETGEILPIATSTRKFAAEIKTALSKSKPKLFWDFFSLMQTPALIDDVVVLPITSFSPGVGHMQAGEPDHPMAFVHHHFEGSWKQQGPKHDDDAGEGDKASEHAEK
ncbi:AFR465Cp [Eremothecium gossypii ATCC 10895]|uniref:AFR465Cp n=1 Tax=Eremothecium gossypii (strain ATCC 10895 / CBS 109.51 / FGSC 9923 / NRRL Y-1056) TaxID=284811 RepID=Q752V8_EREGS|nr:AFR465Cp [Eremothecium gossypii ATCC 10895]AAS53836.1 AFR465Cp [Eremothecium gossypii ATCC 10895]AEY98149.1 FAFR465Cp [Eremothecium gossypii FDAG1]